MLKTSRNHRSRTLQRGVDAAATAGLEVVTVYDDEEEEHGNTTPPSSPLDLRPSADDDNLYGDENEKVAIEADEEERRKARNA